MKTLSSSISWSHPFLKSGPVASDLVRIKQTSLKQIISNKFLADKLSLKGSLKQTWAISIWEYFSKSVTDNWSWPGIFFNSGKNSAQTTRRRWSTYPRIFHIDFWVFNLKNPGFLMSGFGRPIFQLQCRNLTSGRGDILLDFFDISLNLLFHHWITVLFL